MAEKQRLSISSLKTFKACRRQYYLRYKEGLIPVETSNALATGSSYHAKLEELNDTGDFTHDDNYLTSAMAEAYKKYIYPNFKVKSAEDWFSYDLGDGYKFVGITDGITEEGFLVEHKSTSMDTNDEYEYNLLWDEQILAYMMATGTRKVYYTACKKPTIRQKKNETDEEFYQRMIEWYDEDTENKIRCFEITRTDEEVAEFEKQAKIMCKEVENCNNWYINTNHCNKWGTRCPYSSVCLHYDPNKTYVEFTKEERE